MGRCPLTKPLFRVEALIHPTLQGNCLLLEHGNILFAEDVANWHCGHRQSSVEVSSLSPWDALCDQCRGWLSDIDRESFVNFYRDVQKLVSGVATTL